MYKYRLKMKGKNEEDIILDAHVVDRDNMVSDFGESDRWVITRMGKFNCLDVKSVHKFWEVDQIRNGPAHTNLFPYEKRLENIQRLEAYTKAMEGKFTPANFTPQQMEWYEEMRICIKGGTYPKSDWRHVVGMTHKDYQESRKVFWEVLFDSIEHEQATHKAYFNQYLKADSDPRNFNLGDFVRSCRDKEYLEASELFLG